MNRNFEHEELIDLGEVSVETKGPAGALDDTAGGKVPFAGLIDE